MSVVDSVVPAQLADTRSEFTALFEEIARGALERELHRELPVAAVTELKKAGFGALRVPREYGGRGLSWTDITRLWIDLAAADNNLTQALRGHFTFVEDTVFRHRRGSDQSRWFARFAAGEIAGNAWTETGATAIGQPQTELSPAGGQFTVTGRKYYSTGTIFAEWADVYARIGDEHVIALVDTRQPQVTVEDDWDGFGQRGTGSGTAIFDRALVDAAEVLPFAERHPYQTALYQLNLLATLAGIARAALADVVREVRARERNYSHANAARVRNDPQVLARVGEISAAAYTAENLAVAVAAAIDAAADARSDAELQAATERAELDASAAQVVASRLVLEATTDLFDTLGASAASSARGLDRHWRNARTVASHNPRLLKAKVLGSYEVNATPPPYAWAIGRTPAAG